MDVGSVIGLIFAFGMFISAFILEGGTVGSLLILTAAMIVFGGTIGALLVSFPLSEIKKIGSALKLVFTNQDYNEVEIIHQIAELSEKARKDGLLSLEQDAQNNNNPLIRKGLSLVIDGIQTEVIKDILLREIELKERELHSSAEIFEAAGGFSPTMGIIGTVMGLVSILGSLEDSAHLGESIAVAFVATLYGVCFANVVYIPFANKIKVKGKRESAVNEMIIEGLLSIQAGENPRIIKEKLNLALVEKINGVKPSTSEGTNQSAEVRG